MDYFKIIETAMIEAGANPAAVADAVERMMERPASDYFTENGAEFPTIVEMTKAGLSTAVAARITLALIDQYQAISPLHALASMDLCGDEWHFADDVGEEDMDDLDDPLDGQPGATEFSFLGFRCSFDYDDRA